MARKRVAILISGGGSNMEALVRDMRGDPDHPAEPVLVVSNKADAGGLERAKALGVPTCVVDHRPFGKDRAAFDAAVDQRLRDAGAEIICEAGFMRIHEAAFVEGWAGQILNIHPSLLPRHKGLHTHQKALEAGDTEHGCTVHVMTPALDDGPILGQLRIAIGPNDTPDTLATRLLPLEHQLYPAVLRRFAFGDMTPIFTV